MYGVSRPPLRVSFQQDQSMSCALGRSRFRGPFRSHGGRSRTISVIRGEMDTAEGRRVGRSDRSIDSGK